MQRSRHASALQGLSSPPRKRGSRATLGGLPHWTPACARMTVKRSMKPRHHFLAEKLQCGHDLAVRNEAAAIEFRQDAVDAELVLQGAQALGDGVGCADQHLTGQRLVISQIFDALEP